MVERLRTIRVRETDTVASLIMNCRCKYHRYFASGDLQVFRNGVNLLTLDQEATLADVDINKTTTLHAEAVTSANSNNNSSSRSLLNFYVKTLTGERVPVTCAYSDW